MTEQPNTSPNESPSEQDMQEFERKFNEFFESLSEREKPEAAAMVVLAGEYETSQEGSTEVEQGEEKQDVDTLSEKEIESFVAKLDNFHDSLPEGQHQILDSMAAKAFVHVGPEDDQDDVQGHYWQRTEAYYPTGSSFANFNYFENFCSSIGGRMRFRYITWNGKVAFGCWR